MKPKDVYEKLATAYNAKRGVRLSAEDVDELVLRDQAIMDVTFPDREGSMPDKVKALEKIFPNIRKRAKS